MTNNSVSLEARGVWFTETKVEAYFTATFTIRRREVSAKYIADRYECHGGRWTDWRILRQDPIDGVGPVLADKVRDMVNPVILEWLNGDGYKAARQTAIAHFVIRELKDSRYGIASAKRAFEQHRSELTFHDQTRIAQAVDHLEAAEALLEVAHA